MTDLEFVATGGGVEFLSALYIFFQKTTQFLTCFTSLHTPKYKLSIELLKELHILFNFNQRRAKLQIMMHFHCLLLAKIVSIYAFSLCKILSLKIGSYKFFDKFQV